MTRRALIIANGQFDDTRIGALASPVSDADRLSDVLQQESVGSYAVTVCRDFNASEYRLAIQDFFDAASPDDLHFVLISGHGIKDRRGKLHFAARDTNFDKLNATGVEARFLVERMDDSPASQQILFLDTCFSGAFQKGLIGKGVGGVSIGRDDFGDEAATGKAIVTAATGVQLAGEAEASGTVQSVFTRHLIEGIATGQADTDLSGRITLSELYQYVRMGVKRDAPGQTPQPYYYGLDGSVVIALNPQAKASRLPEKLRQRIASKDRVQRAAAVEDLAPIAAEGSVRAGLARQALQDLLNDDSAMVRNLAAEALRKLEPHEAPPPAPPPPAPTPPAPPVHAEVAEKTPAEPVPEPPPVFRPPPVVADRTAKPKTPGNPWRPLMFAGVAVLVVGLGMAALLNQRHVPASTAELTASTAAAPTADTSSAPAAAPAPPAESQTSTPLKAAPPPPATDTTTNEDTGKIEEATRNFVDRYWKMWSSDNATVRASLRDYYADNVKYYGKYISREDVWKEKSTFISTWKNREYSAHDVSTACRGQVCATKFIIEWRAVKDQTICRTGEAEVGFVVSRGEQITEEVSRNLSSTGC